MKGIYLVGAVPVLVVAVGLVLFYSAEFSVTEGAASTTLTIGCDPLQIEKTGPNTVTISGYLKSEGTGISGKEVILSYSVDGVTFNIIGTCTTDGTGYYTYNWDVPVNLPNGDYFIKAEFTGDSDYLGSSAQTSSENTLFVVPEYPLGVFGALLAAFVAFAFFKRLKSSYKGVL